MKILQVTGPGSQFEVLDIPIPVPGPGEALLKVQAVTTCPQWDLHLAHNAPMFVGHQFVYPYFPGQPGHEATGEIEAVGPGVTGLQPGDRVSAWRDVGHDRPGCYAQYVVHRVENLIPVPATLPYEATAPVELAMCLGSSFLMLKQMNVVAGRQFGVCGLGPAGLVAAQMARAEGATQVLGFDLSPARREWAMAAGIGLDRALDPSDLPADITGRPGRPALDCAIDCVGARSSVEFMMDHVDDSLALFGVQRETYRYEPRHYSGLRLLGYKGHSRQAAEYAVGLLAAGNLNLGLLCTHHMPLEGYAEAVRLLEKQDAVKVCFWPWKRDG